MEPNWYEKAKKIKQKYLELVEMRCDGIKNDIDSLKKQLLQLNTAHAAILTQISDSNSSISNKISKYNKEREQISQLSHESHMLRLSLSRHDIVLDHLLNVHEFMIQPHGEKSYFVRFGKNGRLRFIFEMTSNSKYLYSPDNYTITALRGTPFSQSMVINGDDIRTFFKQLLDVSSGK